MQSINQSEPSAVCHSNADSVTATATQIHSATGSDTDTVADSDTFTVGE